MSLLTGVFSYNGEGGCGTGTVVQMVECLPRAHGASVQPSVPHTLGLLMHACDPSPGAQREEDQEFKISLCCTESLRLDWTTWTLSKNGEKEEEGRKDGRRREKKGKGVDFARNAGFGA